VAYVRAYLPQDEKPGQQNGEVDHPYDLFAAKQDIFLPLIQGKPASFSAGLAAAEIMGRSTDSSIAINELPAEEMGLYYKYGITSSLYTAQTPTQTVPGSQLVETTLSSL
jgi:hypothetical protein